MLGTLEVTVIRAINIPNKDIFFSSSDPYVKVTLKKQTWSTYIADLAPKNSTAIWNERLTFKIETFEQLNGEIGLEMWDKDKFGQDDQLLMDKITINLDPVKEFIDIVKIENNGTTLDLVIHYVPFTIMQKLYDKIDQAKENFKKKLINQIMDKLSAAF